MSGRGLTEIEVIYITAIQWVSIDGTIVRRVNAGNDFLYY